MKISNKLQLVILTLTLIMLFIGCGKKQITKTAYNVEMKYDTTSRKFDRKKQKERWRNYYQVYTASREFDCKMVVNWRNNSEYTVSKIPFNFRMDSTKSLPINVFVNNQPSIVELAVKKDQGFDGFILTPKTPIKKGEKANIKIQFKTYDLYFLREGVYFYSECLPVIQYFKNGEFNPNYQEIANYKVRISYPSEYNIATTGVVTQKDTIRGITYIQTHAENVPFYGLVMLKDVIIKEKKSVNGILIRSVFFDDDKKWGNKILDFADDAIRFYYDTLGFYPQQKLTIVPGYHKPYGGYPVCPNIVAVHRGIDEKGELAETHAEWITAHEIGHQYWGYNYILEPLNYPQWFGISMGIYTDRLYCKAKNIKIDYFRFFDKYAKGVEKGYNTTIMQKIDSLEIQGFDWNNIIQHGKSYTAIRMLAHEIGEDNFFKVYKICLSSFGGKIVTPKMFQDVCEKVSGKKLDWFFQQWYFTNDFLEYEIKTVNLIRKNNKYQINCIIKKTGKAQVSNLDIGFKNEDGKIIIKTISGKKEQVNLLFEMNYPFTSIIIDPYRKLPLIRKKDWKKIN